MIVHLRGGDHGHFPVVRPVGHTGRLVQLIDNSGAPEVVDAMTLLGSPRWTGVALLPERTHWAFIASLAAAAGAAVVMMAGFWFGRGEVPRIHRSGGPAPGR